MPDIPVDMQGGAESALGALDLLTVPIGPELLMLAPGGVRYGNVPITDGARFFGYLAP